MLYIKDPENKLIVRLYLTSEELQLIKIILKYEARVFIANDEESVKGSQKKLSIHEELERLPYPPNKTNCYYVLLDIDDLEIVVSAVDMALIRLQPHPDDAILGKPSYPFDNQLPEMKNIYYKLQQTLLMVRHVAHLEKRIEKIEKLNNP